MTRFFFVKARAIASKIWFFTEYDGRVSIARCAGSWATATGHHGLAPVASTPVSEHGQKGVSPFQACALRPVTDGNCVAARQGGK